MGITGRASTCSVRSIRAWPGCDSITSTSSTRTASTPTRPWTRRWARSHSAVRQGKARYVGISSYSPQRTEEAIAILRELGTPLLIHQPSYSMFNRWIEHGLLDVLGREGVGCIAFSPLAQGLLTDKYLNGIPDDSRVRRGNSFSEDLVTDENVDRVRALNEIARGRGQTLAQLALAWVLRDQRVTSALIGASSVEQLEQNVAALQRLSLDAGELARDRSLRGRRQPQHLGAVERRLTAAPARAYPFLPGGTTTILP